MADFAISADVSKIPQVDMISATSKLQLEAADVRNNRPNWNSYLRFVFGTRASTYFNYTYESAIF